MLSESDYEANRSQEEEGNRASNYDEREYVVNGAPLSDLTGFQRDLLVVIGSIGSTHGLGIKTAMDPVYDIDMSSGRIYSNLDQLRQKGLIEKSKVDGRTKSYEITQRGQRELAAYQEWIADGITVQEPDEDTDTTHTAEPSDRVSQVIDDVLGEETTPAGSSDGSS